MAIRFPVKAAVRSGKSDTPPTDDLTIGIFDSMGYWASIGTGSLELPGDMLDVGNKIAALVNAAYMQGLGDARKAMRDALGIGMDD